MRNTIRSYACAFSLIAALAVPVSAASTTDNLSDDFLMTLKNVVIVCYDELKLVIPPG